MRHCLLLQLATVNDPPHTPSLLLLIHELEAELRVGGGRTTLLLTSLLSHLFKLKTFQSSMTHLTSCRFVLSALLNNASRSLAVMCWLCACDSIKKNNNNTPDLVIKYMLFQMLKFAALLPVSYHMVYFSVSLTLGSVMDIDHHGSVCMPTCV